MRKVNPNVWVEVKMEYDTDSCKWVPKEIYGNVNSVVNGMANFIDEAKDRSKQMGIERKRWRTADEWQAKLAKETTRKSLRESEAVIYKRSCHRGQGVMFTGMAGALTVSFASPLLPLLFVIVSLSFCALALLSGLVVAAESAKKLTQSAAEARQAQAELDGLYASPPPSQDV